jgi:hypothetical protein
MTFIILSILVILATIFSGEHWGKKVQIRFVVVVVVIGILLLIKPYASTILNTISSILGNLSFESTSSDVDGKPVWLDIELFVVMLFGMILARIDFPEKNKKFKVNWDTIFYPMLISPITFISFYGLIDNLSGMSFLLLNIFSFQNGFFWGTLLKPRRNQ